jgi:hypothetical protein
VNRIARCAGILAAGLAMGCNGSGESPDEPTAPPLQELKNKAGHSQQAAPLATRQRLIHGIAGDERIVFITEPGVDPAGSAGRVIALDRATGEEIADLPPPAGGFRLPFTLRVPQTGHLVVLDNSGFPPMGAPRVFDYTYSVGSHGNHNDGGGNHNDGDDEHDDSDFSATLTRTVDFSGLPLLFAEDLEVASSGDYIVSESIIGGLWLIAANGAITRGLVPTGLLPLPQLGACAAPALPVSVGGVPLTLIGGFAPGVGSLAERDGLLYFGSTCLGGVYRVPLATLHDTTRSPEQRAFDVETVSPRPAGTALESLKGLAFNRWDPQDEHLYAMDPIRLRVLRIDVDSGEREVVASNAAVLSFPVAASFLPPRHGNQPSPLVISSDQEHRWSGLNGSLAPGQDVFQRPFVVAELYPHD